MDKQQHIKAKADKEMKAMDWYNRKETTSYIREENEYSRFDGVLTSGDTEYLSEIKVRKNYSNEQIQAFGGSYLEFTKLNGILNHKNINDDYRPIVYIVFLKDRVNVYFIQSDPNYYKWELKWLQKNDFDSTHEWKMVTKLNKSEIIRTIKYKNNGK